MTSGNSAQFLGWIRPITRYRSGPADSVFRSEAVCAGMKNYENMITNGSGGFIFSFYIFEASYKLIQHVLTLLKGVYMVFDLDWPSPLLDQPSCKWDQMGAFCQHFAETRRDKDIRTVAWSCQTMWIGWTLMFHSCGCVVLTPND